MNDLPNRQKILLGILVLVIGYYVWDTFLNTPAPPQRQATRPVTTQTTRQNRPQSSPQSRPDAQRAQPVSRQREQLETPTAVTASLEWKSDPFFREIKKPAAVDTAAATNRLEGLKFTGFMHAGNTWIVTINGNWYDPLDYVDGMQITDANDKYVVLEENGTAYKLYFSR